jgi:hypothetical protein
MDKGGDYNGSSRQVKAKTNLKSQIRNPNFPRIPRFWPSSFAFGIWDFGFFKELLDARPAGTHNNQSSSLGASFLGHK